MEHSIVFIFAGIIIIGALLFAFICVTKKGARRLDVERYRVKYLVIENSLKRDEPSSYHLSVLNADKLVDQALRERGIRGKTMGERMKSSVTLFSDRNGIWTAHKLRNMVAHEPDAKVTYDQARHALACFKKALKDLGAI